MTSNELSVPQPPLISLLHHAYPLTAAQVHKDFLAWFYSNYIQLEYDLDNLRLNFFTNIILGNCVLCPILDYKILDLEFLHLSHIDIIDFIVDSINMGYYVTTYLDEYFVPKRNAYQNHHNRHDTMIFGYDLNNKVLKIMGFDKKQHYCASNISFSEFGDSYAGCIDKTTDVILFKAKDEFSYEPSYKFDIINIINLLEDYLFSADTCERLRIIKNPKEGFTYGISVYKELIRYFQFVIENKIGLGDVKPLHLLWEHKKCMVSRIEYLIENNYIDSNNPFLENYTCLQK
jgi:hypothetical protein